VLLHRASNELYLSGVPNTGLCQLGSLLSIPQWQTAPASPTAPKQEAHAVFMGEENQTNMALLEIVPLLLHLFACSLL